jgi:di/tricarboxylate transporter
MLPEDLAKSYGLLKNLSQMTVLPRSTLVGRTIAQAAIRNRYHLSVLAVVRPGSLAPRYLDPRPGLVLEANDQLYIEGNDEDAWRLAEQETLQFALAGPQAVERILGRGQTLAEVSVAPRSNAVGRSFRQLGFGARYNLNVLSLWRRGAPQADHANVPLEFGDAFLVSGPSVKVAELSRDPDYIVLTDHAAAVDFRHAPLALLLLAVGVVPAVLGLAPLAISTMAAALLMVITGCVSLDGARRSLEWKAIFLIAGTMPLATAMEQTGVATAISSSLLSATAPLGAAGTVTSLFLLAAIISITSSNGAAALVMAPIAAQAAAAGAIDLRHALLAVAYGSGCAFVLPMAQWNLLVMGPGGYRTRDFVRFGSAMSAVVLATAVAVLLAT